MSVATAAESGRPGFRISAERGALPLGAIFGVLGTLAGLAVGLLHLDRLPFSVCFFKLATGLPCPTCGTTRALGRLFDLDFAGALAMSPLATVAAALVFVWAVSDLALLLRGRALRLEASGRTASALRVTAVVVLAANWAYLVIAGR